MMTISGHCVQSLKVSAVRFSSMTRSKASLIRLPFECPGVVGRQADHQVALHYAARHVAGNQEGDAAEHLALVNVRAGIEDAADARGKPLVECHAKTLAEFKLTLTLEAAYVWIVMEAALKAIAAPHRRQILSLVRDDELSAGQIAAHFDVTRPAVSQHLGVLKEAGLVEERRNGTRRMYRARPEGLEPVREFLEQFWDERLDTLKREAEIEERKKRDGSEH